MTAQTTTQRTAKHRLAVKERMARYEAALEAILNLQTRSSVNSLFGDSISASEAFVIARQALNPTTAPKTP